MLQRVWLPFINNLLLSWAHRLGTSHHALRSSRVMWPVGSHHAANDPPNPRRHVTSRSSVVTGSTTESAASAPTHVGEGYGERGIAIDIRATWWGWRWGTDPEIHQVGDRGDSVVAGHSIDSAIHSFVEQPQPTNAPQPPSFVACGLSDDDVLLNGYKLNISTGHTARRPPRRVTQDVVETAWGDAQSLVDEPG